VNEEGSLFDVPPAAIGRYLVRRPLGTGTTGPVFQAQDPDTNVIVAIKLFKVSLSPDAAHEVSHALARLGSQVPRHGALPMTLDAGLDEIEAFHVTAFVEGDSLESALRDFGPAAIEDLVPRLRHLAAGLDAAHGVGLVHGAIHPRDILVSADDTHLTGMGVAPILAAAGIEWPIRRPYSAPEVVKGGAPGAAADQFSLAAIAFEWLFGRRISGPAERLVEVRALPGVDRDALSNAFTVALSPDPDTRFASCAAFCEAVAGSLDPAGTAVMASVADEEDQTFVPPVAMDATVKTTVPEPVMAWSPVAAPLVVAVPDPPPSVEAPAERVRETERWSGGMLAATLVVGLVVGFAAGYMARPRALQFAGSASSAGSAGSTGVIEPEKPAAARARPAEPKAAKPVAAAEPGRLLVHSNPPGASVAIDGVTRGVTPLALRDLALGSRMVTVARRGYIPEDRRVVLTRERPSRTIEVRLTASPAAAAGRSGDVAPKLARPRASEGGPTGTLVVESRPAGAAVTINGKPSGVTPLSLDAVEPGEYRITMALQGYRPFATSVRVVAGERARAAASLSVEERE
jgi:hypothetical protein